MTIRERLITVGVKTLVESGHPDCNKNNILSDTVYKREFLSVLKDSKGCSTVVNDTIDLLIAECQKVSKNYTKRYRTAFPNHINFSGWWVLSQKNCVAQLIRNGRNLHDHYLYSLCFKSGQIGAGQFTTEDLMEHGAQFICPTREDLPIDDETKVH